MHTRYIISRLLFVLLIVGSVSCKKKISGEGPVVTQNRSIPDFNRIEVEMDALTYVTQESSKKLSIDAQQNILDIIETPVIDGKLIIRVKNSKRLGSHDKVVIRISNPVINGLVVDGSGDLQMKSGLQAGDLHLAVSGSGSVKTGDLLIAGRLSADISGSGGILALSGTANNADLEISGSGWIDMLPVNVKRVDADISGSGDIKISVIDHLEADISGSGTVQYRGNPSVRTKISGSGTVRKI